MHRGAPDPAGVRADRGGVAAGRDVLAELIVTGDRNSFFLGGYQRLADAYIEPGEVFERVRLERFTGREWLAARLDRFLDEHDRGYFVIEAPAGLGKTTFLAHTVRERGWVHHFSELAPGDAGIVAARLNLAAQLIRTYELRADGHGSDAVLPEAAAARPDFLRALLAEAAGRRRDGERIVVAVDALDEAAVRPGENVLGLPRVLPAGVYVVATKRPVPIPLTEGPLEVVAIAPGSAENLSDVRRFLADAISRPGVAARLERAGHDAGAFAATLLDRSEGVWIYLHFVLEQLGDGSAGEVAVDDLPQGLWRWYHRFWHRWQEAHPDDWERTHLPLLATLAAAGEELTLGRLCELAATEPLGRLPAAWRPFVAVRREGTPRYRFQHASLDDFFHGRATTSDTAEQDFADELAAATRAAHARMADRHLAAWGGLDAGLPALPTAGPTRPDDAYGLGHVAAHLRHAGRITELHRLVEHPAWQRACLAHDPSAGSYLGSLAVAWDAAYEVDRDAIARGDVPPLLAQELRCAVAVAEAHAVLGWLPIELVVRLLGTGAWTPEQALHATSMMNDALGFRTHALAQLVPHLTGAARRRAIDAVLAALQAEELDWFGAVELVELAPHVEPAVLPAVLGLARGIRHDATRATTLVDLAAAAGDESGALVSEAIAALAGIAGAEERSSTLARIVGKLPVSRREEALAAGLREPVELRAAGIEALAPFADDALRDRLLTAAAVLDDAARIRVQAALAGGLQPAPAREDAGERLAAAEAIPDPSARARTLIRLAGSLTGAAREDVAARALGAVVLCERDERGTLIGDLAPWLPDRLVEDALAAMPGPGEPALRLPVALYLAPHLPDMAPSPAELASWLTSGTFAAADLTDLVPFLPPDCLPEALHAASALRGPAEGIALRVALAARVSEPLRTEVLLDALAATEAIDPALRQRPLRTVFSALPEAAAAVALGTIAALDDPCDRASSLVALVPRLPAGEVGAAVAAAVAALDALEPAELRAGLLGRLAGVIPDALVPGLLAVTRQDPPEIQAEARARLAPHVPAELREAAVRDALASLGAIAEASSLAAAIAALAPHLPQPCRAGVVATARAIEPPTWRVQALAALVPYLEAGTREAVAGEAIAAMGADTGWYWEALPTLAAHLAPSERDQALTALLQRATADPDRRSQALVELAPHLPAAALPDALTICRSIEDPERRSWVLGELGPRLTADLAERGLAMASAIADPALRAVAIAGLARGGASAVALHRACRDVSRDGARDGVPLPDVIRAIAPALGALATPRSALTAAPGIG